MSDPTAAFFESFENEIAPGVRAVVVDDDPTEIVIVWLRAARPGSGDVGRWLDTLPTDRKIKVISVSNELLAATLERRGFAARKVLSPNGEDWFDAHVRPAARST